MTRRWMWFSAILLLAAVLRIVNLDALPLWIDEGFSYLAVKSPDLLTALVRDVHPPLYFVLLKAWAGVTGVSEFALRYPSALLGVLSAALIVPLAREIVWLRGRASDRDQRLS
nr:glycosyltransferase family 39 protein [Aggregatilineales bacterium]